MGELGGFLRYGRELPKRRPVSVRVRDWREVYEPFPDEALQRQAARCMDCGIPFCHHACPLGNLIPEWNDLTWRGEWAKAAARLHRTNNFPELTGRLCPAPCEEGCVLGISAPAVTIKQVELQLAEHAASEGLEPEPPRVRTGRAVAVVGSGPAGLAAAQQLTRAGHEVVVFERAPRPGGLLRYGIPEFKLEKWVLDRRLAQMEAEGTTFRTNVEVGGPSGPSGGELREAFDAVVLATGAPVPRDLSVPGRELEGIVFAMDYLTQANLVQEGAIDASAIDAAGRDVVILGGGDTGADCLGTAHRQGARSVTQVEILDQPPLERSERDPWPVYPTVLRVSAAHEEGGERVWSFLTERFADDGHGRVAGILGRRVRAVQEGGRTRFEPVGEELIELRADLVVLAMGFLGSRTDGVVEQVGARLDERGNVVRDSHFATDAEGVFCAGDAGRGQSLIVWAIAEGRSAAAAVDAWLTKRSVLTPCIDSRRVAMR
jgi:glutamate synthase (NADPH/NADH) small chain